MHLERFQKVAFISFVSVIIVSLIIYQTVGDNISIEDMRNYINDFGVWSPIVFIILYTIITIFIPSTPLMAISGILFGFSHGLLYTVIGGFFSSIIVFYLGRILGEKWVESILTHKYLKTIEDYNRRLEGGALTDLIVLRILPIMPFNVLNIVMGVSKIKIKDYIIGTIIGLAPSNVLSVYLGTFITKIF